MKTIISGSVGLCLLLVCVHADVSELFNPTHRPPPLPALDQPAEIQTCLILTNNVHRDEPLETEAPVDQQLAEAIPEALTAESEVVEADVATVQLDQSHPDFQGPYHYELPKVKLEYVAPEVDDVPPEGRDLGVTKNEYLPPLPSTRDAVAKRNVKFWSRGL